MKTFQVGDLAAASGEKVQSYLQVVNSDLHIPITIINGTKAGKTVVITSGVHGGEYPGIETAIRLANELAPEQVAGQIAILHPVNLPAFAAKTQYVGPLDGVNLNRAFPGKAMGTITERIAYTISSQLFSQADFYMDLHGGDIHEALVPFVLYPKAAGEEVAEVSRQAAACLGVPHVVGSVSTAGTFGSAASLGVPGFLGEIGQCGLWSEEDVALYLRGVKNVLKHLEVLPGEVEVSCPVTYHNRMAVANAAQSGCWYPCVQPGDEVKKGQKLGEIRDFFARVLGEYYSEVDGVVLYVISSLAINAGEPIAAVGERID